MATYSNGLALTTTFADVATADVGQEVTAFGLVFVNTTGATRTITLRIHNDANATDVDVPFELASKGRGSWDKPIALQPGDVLSAKADASGVSLVWSTIVDDGVTPISVGMTPRGDYSALATYAVNDYVRFGGKSWASRVSGNIGNQPDTSPTQWQLWSQDFAFAPEDPGNKGVAGGYAPLDGSAKVATAYLPAAVLGALSYQTTWDASTNTPTIPAASSGNKGHYYMVSVSGSTSLDGITDWVVGDWAVSNGTIYEKIDNTDAVSSVAGLIGPISAASLRTALALVVGTHILAYEAKSAAFAALEGADNKLAYLTGATTMALTDLTAAGRALLDDADAAAQRTTLGLGSLATASTITASQISDPANVKTTESLIIAVGDETTAITTGTAKVTFRMPYAFTLTAVRASLTTASSSGLPTVDINEGGVSILSTKLTIDANEKTSTSAATAAVISDASLADDAEMTIDIDVAGTGAKGLKVYLIGTRT